jgi:hypothetical protein
MPTDRASGRSEYDPLFSGSGFDSPVPGEDDMEAVRERFAAASRPYLHSPWSWLAWALFLPAAAFLTPEAVRRAGPAGALFVWSTTILVGGAVEIGAIWQAGRAGRAAGRASRTPLAAYVLRLQGNLSFVALALSALLVWLDAAWALPGLWLLLLGHSFYMLGGLAFPPFRICGLIFQLGGLAALWPEFPPLPIFALATAAGNLWMALQIWRERRGDAQPAR